MYAYHQVKSNSFSENFVSIFTLYRNYWYKHFLLTLTVLQASLHTHADMKWVNSFTFNVNMIYCTFNSILLLDAAFTVISQSRIFEKYLQRNSISVRLQFVNCSYTLTFSLPFKIVKYITMINILIHCNN